MSQFWDSFCSYQNPKKANEKTDQIADIEDAFIYAVDSISTTRGEMSDFIGFYENQRMMKKDGLAKSKMFSLSSVNNLIPIKLAQRNNNK